MKITQRRPTQEDVDDAICRMELLADHYETLRDDQPYESESYWHYHDKAESIIAAMRELMP